jgi:hypothetical protein
MNFASMRDLLQDPEILIPGFSQKTPASVVYSNAAAIGLRSFARRMLQTTYLPHHNAFEPVVLGRLPAGIRLLGGNCYWLDHEGTLAIDQINPLTPDVKTDYEALRALPFEVETITQECILVARYGDDTWGHWVAEILPRAILAEHAYPGRFRFAVAEQLLGGPEYTRRVYETLSAYGIAAERIVKLRFAAQYRFENLYAVVNIWSPGGMNPQVMQIMRDDIAAPLLRHGNGRLAVLRRESKTRNLANLDEIIAILQQRDYTIVDMATQSFVQQVAFFRDSANVFGILGSGLIGLIYAPEEVSVATLGPRDWDDTYFHGLIQLRRGAHADIRCPVIWSGEGLQRDAPMVAIPAHVQAGLAALAMPETERAPNGILDIGGAPLRRHAGETILHADFGVGGMANVFLREGWASPEPKHIWTIGPRSVLSVPRPFETEDIELQLEVIGLVDSEFLIARKLDITVNGIRLGSFAVAGYAQICCAMPSSCFTEDLAMNIVFEQPFCVSAAATGHAPDDRPLGIGFVALRLVSHAPPVKPALRVQEPVAGAA